MAVDTLACNIEASGTCSTRSKADVSLRLSARAPHVRPGRAMTLQCFCPVLWPKGQIQQGRAKGHHQELRIPKADLMQQEEGGIPRLLTE
eukprot:4172163-Amphidinium_carterae.1